MAKECDCDGKANELYDKHCDNTCPCTNKISGKPVSQFRKTTLLPVGVGEGITGVLDTTGDWDTTIPVCHTTNSTAPKQMLDSIKVLLNGHVVLWTGLSVDLQALHQVFLEVCVDLSAVDKEHTGHCQLHQHQNKQQDKKTDEHAAVLPHAT